MQRFFQVTPPKVHQMLLTLEKAGLIAPQPSAARSNAVQVDHANLATPSSGYAQTVKSVMQRHWLLTSGLAPQDMVLGLDVHERTRAVDRAINVAPAPAHLEVCPIHIPTAAHRAAPAPPQVLGQFGVSLALNSRTVFWKDTMPRRVNISVRSRRESVWRSRAGYNLVADEGATRDRGAAFLGRNAADPRCRPLGRALSCLIPTMHGGWRCRRFDGGERF